MTETGGDDAPSRAGYVDDAIRRMRVAAAAAGRGGAPGAAGTADPEVLRAAVATLPPDDQRLLWATHVQRQEPSAVAAALGTHPRAAARLLPQAEQTLAAALADAHARGCPPGCADTRRALDDLVHRRVPAGQEAFEDHLLDCAACLRAFVDVREPAWALRDAGPRLLAGGWHPPAVAAAAGPGDSSGVVSRPARRQSWLIVAGTVACVAVAATAVALGSGDPAPAAPDPGSSPAATTVGTVPGGGTSPASSSSSVPRGDGGASASPTPSGDASATPSGEPSPTPSSDDAAATSDPSTSPTSSPGRDEPTSSSSSPSSGSPGSSASVPSSEDPGPSTDDTDTPTDDSGTSTGGTDTGTGETPDAGETESPEEPSATPSSTPSPTATPTSDPEPTDGSEPPTE
ncbi:hypothetical protein AAG589_20170 [Isoptericola sp. F-RaC21]|uniref:hypothetical protein n=1 Tax=Isoptericola sp. F-RaC21 TaxID=3141452 RepID=UPI00315B429A